MTLPLPTFLQLSSEEVSSLIDEAKERRYQAKEEERLNRKPRGIMRVNLRRLGFGGEIPATERECEVLYKQLLAGVEQPCAHKHIMRLKAQGITLKKGINKPLSQILRACANKGLEVNLAALLPELEGEP